MQNVTLNVHPELVGSYICPKCEEGYELGMKLKKHTQEGTSKLAPALRKIGFGLPKL